MGTEIVYYSDGNSINLTFYVDTITLSTGHYVGEVQFGVADYTDYDNGVLGLGFGESSGNTDYRNFIEQLASQEITNSKAFSLALGNLSAVDSGIIIFGGVDTKKFSGSLSANEIVPRDSNYAITMESVGVGRIGDVDVMNFTDSSTTVALESTVRMTFLPNATVTALLKYFNVTDYEDYTLSCTSVANSTSFVSFNFVAWPSRSPSLPLSPRRRIPRRRRINVSLGSRRPRAEPRYWGLISSAMRMSSSTRRLKRYLWPSM